VTEIYISSSFARPSAPPTRIKRGGPAQLWELFALGLLLAVYLITIGLVGDSGTFFVNLVGPVVFGVILLADAIPGAMRDPNQLWTPLFWFRVSGAAYFSFGTIVPYMVNDTSKDAIAGFFREYTDLVTKLNAVTTLGTLVVLGAAYATYHLFYAKSNEAPNAGADDSVIKSPKLLLSVGTMFIVIGSVVKYGFAVPYGFGITHFVLPGSVTALGLLADAGIYMIAVWAWHYRPSLLVIPFALTFIDMIVGILQFAKTEVIAAVIVLALAWLSKGVTFRRLGITTALVIATFALALPFVNSGREEMERRYQSLEGAGLSERLEIAGYYFQPKVHPVGDEQSGLLRFSYVNCGTLALSLFDTGKPGGTMATAPAAFIPRALWPDKPNMTQIGQEFNYIATGSDRSASSPGWMAESYWDYGWLGALIVLTPVGIILQVWSGFSLRVMRAGRWLYFPFCLLGMRMGAGIDGFIVPGVFGPAILVTIVYFAIAAAVDLYGRSSVQLNPMRG
jgi:hypothetical protein